MKRGKLRGKKLNNKGVTLVELIVAIAILSVAIIPLMYAFVNVARFSGRGREVQQATSIAHTVMENCKAYSVADITKQMQPGATTKFLDSKFATEGLSVGGYYVDDTDSTKFYIDNVRTGNQVFDVCLELDPYTDNLGNPASENIFNIENMNPALDGIFMAQSTKDVYNTVVAMELDEMAYMMAMEDIANEVKDFTNDASNGYEYVDMSTDAVIDSFKSGELNEDKFRMNRNVYLDMRQTAGSDDIAMVYYEYEYYLTGDFKFLAKPTSTGTPVATPTPDPLATPGPTSTAAPTNTEVPLSIATGVANSVKIFNKTDTTNNKAFKIYGNNVMNDTNADLKLNNVYMFYTPAYNKQVEYPITQDTIHIDNGLGREVNVYLIKQIDLGISDVSVGGSDTKLQIAESYYRPKVVGTGAVKLYHNLDKNLSTGIVYLNNADLFDATWTTLTPTTDLIETKPTQMMFRIHLNIYHSNAYEPAVENKIHDGSTAVLSMNGTKVDW